MTLGQSSERKEAQGGCSNINLGADIFLADVTGRYLGRICHYRECHPRVACLAQHCGRREHLNDDLHVVTLSKELLAGPPVDLWPNVIRRITVPADVEALLLTESQASSIVRRIRVAWTDRSRRSALLWWLGCRAGPSWLQKASRGVTAHGAARGPLDRLALTPSHSDLDTWRVGRPAPALQRPRKQIGSIAMPFHRLLKNQDPTRGAAGTSMTAAGCSFGGRHSSAGASSGGSRWTR